jgi:hypothetical protein
MRRTSASGRSARAQRDGSGDEHAGVKGIVHSRSTLARIERR